MIRQNTVSPTPIILDTDMDTDCDDAGALAVLNRLIDLGECELAGVVCSLPLIECAAAVQAINQWYGRPAIPIGRHRVVNYESASDWAAYRAHRQRYFNVHNGTPYNIKLRAGLPQDALKCRDAVVLYRSLLSNARDGSITICAIGTLTALADLLPSAPDDLSPLDGKSLVQAKVRELVTMAAAPFPSGVERFNWSMDRVSARLVLREWPTPITVSPAGDSVLTGARFVAAAPPDHPVRAAYVSFLGGEGRNRPSWDLIAALYAVRGMDGPFAQSGPLDLEFDSTTAAYHWRRFSGQSGARRLLLPLLEPVAMADALEELLIDSLRRSA